MVSLCKSANAACRYVQAIVYALLLQVMDIAVLKQLCSAEREMLALFGM